MYMGYIAPDGTTHKSKAEYKRSKIINTAIDYARNWIKNTQHSYAYTVAYLTGYLDGRWPKYNEADGTLFEIVNHYLDIRVKRSK